MRWPAAAPSRCRAGTWGPGSSSIHLVLDDALAAELRDDPARLAEQFHDLVAAGQVRQFRTLLGVLAGGWRFVLRRDRHSAGPVIMLAWPGEPLPETLDGEFVAAVTDLDHHLATSGAAPAP